ncbi:Thiol:disulfide interchange protein DsbC [hydrothermal vent metagenome]|uniref:Thiol:disulfide interchange protein DsbC n=1 Tax=hydrothermal vent metagenome TaxID=652676 RepID=A0A3B0YGF9_9ZZZZ
MKAVKTALIALALVCFTQAGRADEASDMKAIRGALGGISIGSIGSTPIPGLYEVVIGSQVVYVSADGRYVLQGELVDFKTQKSLTEERRSSIRREIVDSIDESKMIIFKPEKVKYVVTVFTDIDCGYCRKLHSQIDQYLEKGIEIRYLFFPRSGPNTPSYYKAVSVWCSDDRKKALTDAKNNRSVPDKTCDNPIDEHMQLARKLGLRGTPFALFENGQSPPGYVAPDAMLQMLEQIKAGNQ